ncbi:hypothetical protein [Alteromonas sp. H39]|uniref:hypothetical protein n=1 Tax=Alteromonas sp. H39 TaxID=3389876 RepID=UPI0039E18BBA
MIKITRFHTVPANGVMLTHAAGHWTTREVGEFVNVYRSNVDRLRTTKWGDLIVLHQGLEMSEGVSELLKPEIVRASQVGLRAVAIVNLSDNPLINTQSHLFRIYQDLGITVCLFAAFEPACEWLEAHGFIYAANCQEGSMDLFSQTELMDKKQPAL